MQLMQSLIISVFSQRSLLAAAVLSFLCAGIASSQDDIYPTVLYSGVNPLTVSASDGIDKIEVYTADGWKPLVIGQKTRNYRVMTTPIFSHCAKKVTFKVFVERIDRNFELELRVTDCDGSRTSYSLDLENVWTLYHEDFGTVTLDDKPCHTFVVQSNGGDFIVDGVTCASRQFQIFYPFREPPVKLRGTQTYRYSVCFTPLRTGRLKVPVNVLIRRGQPAGGYTTYVVADTAYVNVIQPPERNIVPDPPPRVIEPPPKPRPPQLPPSGPTTPPKPPARVITAYPLGPEELPDFIEPTVVAEKVPDVVLPESPEYVFDPTTFRTILTPTARTLGKGQGFVASYDGAGILAGYGVSDQLTVIGGGVYVPPGISKALAISLGGKYAFHQTDEFRVAGGFQANYSSTDESDVVSAAPYVTGNYGTIDRAVNVTVGYSWRRHSPSDTSIAPFTRLAALVGVGGDYRFANRWKVATEIFAIEDSEYQPLAVTLRYFGNRFAIDAGVAVDLIPENGLTPLPVVSGVWTW